MPHSVLAIANEFLSMTDTGNALTPMHLQKLCYFAHGFSLALLDEPLAGDRVEAWEFGPVFPTLYDALRRYGARPVGEQIRQNNWASSEKVRGDIVAERFSKDEREIIQGVFDTYGDFEAFQLSALTHEEDSPWDKVYKAGKRNLIIPDELIKEYFSELATGE